MKRYLKLKYVLLLIIVSVFGFTNKHLSVIINGGNSPVNYRIVDSADILPKVSINDILIVSPKELLQMRYDTGGVIKDVQILVVTSDQFFLKKIDLVTNKEKKPKINCSYYYIANADDITAHSNGIILLNKNYEFNKDAFSAPQTTVKTIDEEECGTKLITTKFSFSADNDTGIHFIQYVPLSEKCSIDPYNYDEFINYNKEAHIIYDNKKEKTGLIWNSPEGYAGY